MILLQFIIIAAKAQVVNDSWLCYLYIKSATICLASCEAAREGCKDRTRIGLRRNLEKLSVLAHKFTANVQFYVLLR